MKHAILLLSLLSLISCKQEEQIEEPKGERFADVDTSSNEVVHMSDLDDMYYSLDEVWLRSPSNCRTVSTMCSKILGPAILPSLVMCPIRSTGVAVSLANLINSPVHSLICETLPAVLSM